MFWSLLALSMHFLCLFLLNLPSPLGLFFHFHFHIKTNPFQNPTIILLATDAGGREKCVEMGDGGREKSGATSNGAAGTGKAGCGCSGAEIHLRVPKDVYSEYHKLVKDPEDSKKIIPSKTIPGRVVEIQRTSDNLYRALAYALTGTEMLHKATRMVVLEYFESFFGQWDKKQAQPWMDEYEVRSVRRQAEKIKAGKAGGTVELIAAAKKFNMNVLVYKTDKDMWLCMSPKTAHKWDLDKNCQSKDAMTIALELYDNENYDVIMDVQQKK
uniref:Esophageal gland-localized secretory protein 17 n=1 Tax=Heterodera glycines TaxID=51029 RepID=A0A0E3JCI7_HETGL|nr:esophageal gland-localized secretory protein 17 [Heterodera glycines]